MRQDSKSRECLMLSFIGSWIIITTINNSATGWHYYFYSFLRKQEEPQSSNKFLMDINFCIFYTFMLCVRCYKYADTCKSIKYFVDIILPEKIYNNKKKCFQKNNGKGYVY